MVTFLLETDDLKLIVKRLKIIQRINNGKRKALLCEVTVKDGCIELNAPGLFQVMAAQTNGTCKFTLPITFFTKVTASYKKEYLNFIVTEGRLEMEDFICKVNTTFFEDDSVLRSIQLPINFKDRDLLILTGIAYTQEELHFNNIVPQVNHAKKKLVMDLIAAAHLLADYDVSYAELRTLVCNKLNIDPIILVEDEIRVNPSLL